MQEGQSYAFATLVESTLKGTPRKTGAKMIVLADGSLFGSIGGGRNEKAAKEECLKAICSGKPALVTYDYFGQEGQSICGGQIKVFIEPFIQQNELIICGGGHIALPLSFLAKMMHMKVIIIDNRKEFANKKRFPHADQILCGDYLAQLNKLTIQRNSYIMIVTQGNEHDFECLKALITTEAGYLGVISSQLKKIKFFKRLKKVAIPDKLLKKVTIPAGIDLGAQTPEEIAISIFAEIIAIKNKELLGTTKFKMKKKEIS